MPPPEMSKLEPEQMNRITPWIVRGDTVEEFLAANPSMDEAEVRGFWDRTVAYMEANPLPVGGVWDTVEE